MSDNQGVERVLNSRDFRFCDRVQLRLILSNRNPVLQGS
jgi:hypothetical protein